MQLSSLTRRQVLVSGALGMGCLASARAVRAATAAATPASTSSAPAAPAAGAGTLRLGGDLIVNRMGFGAMRVTGPGIWGEPKDPAEARRVLRRTVELGVNFIDTADAYGPEVSERLIAEALYPYPPGLVIATKGGMIRPSASEWAADGRPQHLREACEASLARLKLARIDLYQLHRIDPNVPLEDSLGELSRLRQQGKIRHVGVSNFSLAELERAQRVVPIVSVQNRYNIADRSSEAVLSACAARGLTFIPWAPIARGSADTLEGRSRKALEQAAADHGVSVLQVAIAWLLARSAVMLPIPGTSSVAHLEENVAAAGVKLSPAELAAIG
ncbi:MAG TPA: aldo/keto reductase [Steroidobacteraceae bacterium]|nr:aldo/keto reductase [Steroidobacteraceae bacterium]